MIQSGLLRRNSPPPGFDPRTIQPVASRYTDRTITIQLLAKYRDAAEVAAIFQQHSTMSKYRRHLAGNVVNRDWERV